LTNADAPFSPLGEFLDPGDLRVERTPDGRITVQSRDERWPDAQLRLPFPLTQTDRMVAFLGPDEEYLGTVRDFHELDPLSRRVVEEELGQTYFQPAIVRIQSLKKRLGLNEMLVITEAGPRLIRFRSARDDIREIGPGHYLLTDAAGNRFEIPCVEALDEPSRRLWHNLV